MQSEEPADSMEFFQIKIDAVRRTASSTDSRKAGIGAARIALSQQGFLKM
ncbi:hypothetical protein ACQUWN_06220 [Rossellomorea aquimaris]|nr:hypothetical protein [Rossellomorea vietnamensis]